MMDRQSSVASGVHVVSTVPTIRILETIDSLCIDNIGWQAVPHVLIIF